jgi:phage shock protein PspC (stress-responsive transcriptional regulator)
MNASDARQEADIHPGQETGPGQEPAPGAPAGPALASGQPALFRPLHDRMLAGVAAGIANYLGVDVTVVRIVLAVLVFVGGAGIPVYLAGWLLIPEEGAERSIASEFASSLRPRSY